MREPAHHGKSLLARPSAGARAGRDAAPPGGVVVTSAASGCRTRVAVRGELDLNAGRHLRHRLHTALADSACGLDLDLSRLGFCDCAGLSVLLDLRQQALRQGKTVTIGALGPAVERLLELVGARGLFDAPHVCRRPAPRPGAGDRTPAAGHSPSGPLTTVSNCSRPARASRESVR
ncbi:MULTISPECIES: STAS domain-containing protein [unclassified Streptomyces]|uniref:STAS domain-containing protein n=1 Tax=unclassified Streptomyces TaxID=2593676 RepID=UPI00368471E3